MNELSQSESLYLKQHASNPVHWKMWNEKAFLLAQEQQKPLLVSIGYAACHWCHVMEHESFENQEIADFMNQHFICIKVDREEHPDVDNFYMDALTAMTNQGGWPLNMFVTPEKKPFYGGTYFPPHRMYGKPSWMEVLLSIHKYWIEQREELLLQSEQLIQHLKQVNQSLSVSNVTPIFDDVLVRKNILLQADEQFGGFGNAPKFPSIHTLEYLLTDAVMNQNEDAANHVYFTLQKMLESGIYDAVGGGLCRYSVDVEWKVPHFEKMLYDNAMMVSLLSKAYQVSKEPIYKKGLMDILDWCNKNWKDANGLYYSASDADSEGVEGKYYVWKYDEIIDIISEDERLLLIYYNIYPEGNWEHGNNILHAVYTIAEFCELNDISEAGFLAIQVTFLHKLLALRKHRIPPAIDTKQQLSWNALLCIAWCDAYEAIGDEHCRNEAVSLAAKMIAHFWNENDLLHLNYQHLQLLANADDWAYLIKALIKVAVITQDNQWLHKAATILEWGQLHFYDVTEQMYYFSSQTKQDIPVRKIDTFDNAQPSVNAVMAECLLILGITLKHQEWISISRQINAKLHSIVQRYPLSFSCSVRNILLENKLQIVQISEVVSSKYQTQREKEYYPDMIIFCENNLNLDDLKEGLTMENSEKPNILVCNHLACVLPNSTIKARFEKYC